MTSEDTISLEEIRATIQSAVKDVALCDERVALMDFTATVFQRTGAALEVTGHIIGADRKTNASPFGNGSDEAVGVAVVLRIAYRLIAGYGVLLSSGNAYAAAALLRQLVEVEYLAWAFDTRNRDAERWLRSDKKTVCNFSVHENYELRPTANFEDKTTAIIVRWGVTLFPTLEHSLMMTVIWPSFSLPICSAIRDGYGIT